MTSSIRQIEFLARAIVNRLEDRGLVEFGDAEIGITVVARTLEENLAAYDSIEQEARARLARSGTSFYDLAGRRWPLAEKRQRPTANGQRPTMTNLNELESRRRQS